MGLISLGFMSSVVWGVTPCSARNHVCKGCFSVIFEIQVIIKEEIGMYGPDEVMVEKRIVRQNRAEKRKTLNKLVDGQPHGLSKME